MAGCYSESMCCSIALVFAENTTCVCTYVCVFSCVTPHSIPTSCTVHRLVHTPCSVPTSCTVHRLIHAPHSVPTSCTAHILLTLSPPHVQHTYSSLCPYLMYSTHTPHSVPTSCTAHILLTLSLPHVQHTYSSLCPYLMYSTHTPHSVPTSCTAHVLLTLSLPHAECTYMSIWLVRILTNRIHRFCMLFEIHTYTHMYVCTKHVYRDIRISYCMYIRRQIVGMVDIGHGCFSSCCVQKPT